MAREDLTFEDVVSASQLDERTLRSVARGDKNPHARTLHKLAKGLGISIDELFRVRSRSSLQQFDRVTNSLVEDVIAQNLPVFTNWADADFEELFSRFGTGGQLTEAGVLAAADAINAKRDLLRRVSVILESSDAALLTELVEMLYRRATNSVSSPINSSKSPHDSSHPPGGLHTTTTTFPSTCRSTKTT